MKKSDLMTLKLIEECAEVQQRACKMMQFGRNESQATAPRGLGGDSPPPGTNFERLQTEFIDLCAVGQLLSLRFPTPEEVGNKLRKIEKYMEYSIECGTLK